MLCQTAKLEDERVIITSSKIIDQSKLTSDCLLIQFDGLNACKNCGVLGTKECGGKKIRKKLLGA